MRERIRERADEHIYTREVNVVAMEPEMRTLKDRQRIFVHKLVYDGLERHVAYAESHNFDITPGNIKSMKDRAFRLFYSPNVNVYYHALLEEVRDKESERGAWTREVSTKKLMTLINKAEEDIYGDPTREIEAKQLTMSRLNAIILSVKELNTMNGFNTTTNLHVEGAVVHISGETEIED